jgi:hypothetical protein
MTGSPGLRGLPALLLALGALAPAGCSDDVAAGNDAAGDTASDAKLGLGLDYDATSGGPVARYEPGSADFTATPWPSDRHRDASGRVDLSAFPNPNQIGLVDDYLDYGSQTLDGFSRNGAVYFQLSAPLDPTSLPDDAASMSDPKALAQLVDLTPGSPDHGRRFPLELRARDGVGDPYYLGHTLVMRPVYGFPLADAGVYCAFLTRGLKDAAGNYLERAPDFPGALTTEPSLAPLRDWLPGSALIDDDLAAATCFTTQDATRDMRRIEAFLATRPTSDLYDVTFSGSTQPARA